MWRKMHATKRISWPKLKKFEEYKMNYKCNLRIRTDITDEVAKQ